MQKKQGHNNKRRQLQHRKHLKEIHKRQGRLPKKRLSGRSRGKQPFVNSGGVASNHLLRLPVRNFNFFHAESDYKLRSFIQGVYPCLKHVPGFDQTKQWDKLPTLEELAMFLLNEVKANCPKGYDWMISDEEGDMSIYYYQICPVKFEFSHVCLDWLEEIKQIDGLLFEMICAMIYKIHTRFNFSMITDQFTEMVIYESNIERGLEEDGEDQEVIYKVIQQKQVYLEHGKANKLFQYMQRQAENYSNKLLIDSIKQLRKTRSKIKNEMIEWLNLGIECLNNPVDLDSFVLPLDGYEDGALNVKSNYSFPYSFYDQCQIRGEEWRNDTYSNIGEMDPAVFYHYTENGASEPADAEPIKHLNKFMGFGRGIFWRNYEDKYKKLYEIN